MFTRKLITVAALAFTTIAPTFAFAAPVAAAPCILRDHATNFVLFFIISPVILRATEAGMSACMRR
jgi:hypothetical protein